MMDKKLYRSSTNKVLGGVCGGFAKYFGNVDPTWIRLVTALLILAGGISLWVYIICWIVMPMEPYPTGIDEQ